LRVDGVRPVEARDLSCDPKVKWTTIDRKPGRLYSSER